MLVLLTVLYFRSICWFHLQFYIYGPYVGTTYSFIFSVHMLVLLTVLYLWSICWYYLQFYIYGPHAGSTYSFIFTVHMLVLLTVYHSFAIFKPQFGRKLKIFNFIFRFNSVSCIFLCHESNTGQCLQLTALPFTSFSIH